MSFRIDAKDYRLDSVTLTNFISEIYKRFHKELLGEGVKYPSDRFIELLQESCRERWKFLNANDKL